MILLDTNVISEPMRPEPDPRVLTWLDSQHPSSLHLSTITAAELLAGVAKLPVGRKRAAVARAVTQIIETDFHGRVLPFDTRAAVAYAAIREERARRGRPIGMADAMIAATARDRHLSVATRNLKDFEGAGVDLINPWDL